MRHPYQSNKEEFMGTIGETQWAEMKVRQSQQDAADLFAAVGEDGDELKIVSDEAADAAAQKEAEAAAAEAAGEEPAPKATKAKAST
jgi:hypothetical protein